MAAIVVVCHFVSGLLLAASPNLHKLLHHDFDGSEHACFATIMATGGCDAPGVPLVAAAYTPDIFLRNPPPETGWVDSVFMVGTAMTRAPPVLLS